MDIMEVIMSCGISRMSCDISVCIPLLLVISYTSTGSGAKLSVCKGMSVRKQEKRCNPELGDVNTRILLADGQNFTQLCR